jgi:hypothetical protein
VLNANEMKLTSWKHMLVSREENWKEQLKHERFGLAFTGGFAGFRSRAVTVDPPSVMKRSNRSNVLSQVTNSAS